LPSPAAKRRQAPPQLRCGKAGQRKSRLTLLGGSAGKERTFFRRTRSPATGAAARDAAALLSGAVAPAPESCHAKRVASALRRKAGSIGSNGSGCDKSTVPMA